MRPIARVFRAECMYTCLWGFLDTQGPPAAKGCLSVLPQRCGVDQLALVVGDIPSPSSCSICGSTSRSEEHQHHHAEEVAHVAIPTRLSAHNRTTSPQSAPSSDCSSVEGVSIFPKIKERTERATIIFENPALLFRRIKVSSYCG